MFLKFPDDGLKVLYPYHSRMEVNMSLNPPVNYGVAEAIILCRNEYTAKVLCPFCKTKHSHGVGGEVLYERVEYRGSHCKQGEYCFKVKPIVKSK